MSTNDDKQEFINRVLFSNTLQATVQRAHIYSSAPEEARDEFRDALRTHLENMSAKYRIAVSDAEHMQNIVTLSNKLSATCRRSLRGGRFRIGPAQKALNLYLKYLWCLGQIPEPPHCPFDYGTIGILPGCSDIRWTSLDKIDDYARIVEAAREVARPRSLAQWELRYWCP